MTINLKRFNGRYIVTADGKNYTFAHSLKALEFVFDVKSYGVAYTCEVYEKLACMHHLGILKAQDTRADMVRQMLLDLKSGILMDNAIRGVITRDYTLDQLLIRKGYAQ